MSLSVAFDITAHAKPPRVLLLPFRMGHQFGVPFHKELQKDVIRACLELLPMTSGTRIERPFPKTWAAARREGKVIEQMLHDES